MNGLVLASRSPRRRALMAAAGLSFRTRAPDVDETPRPGESPAAYAVRVARDKAEAVAARLAPARGGALVVIGCDTVVALDGGILGKPSGTLEAAGMLRRLSGRRHEVFSGLCVRRLAPGRPARNAVRVVRTQVAFRRLAEEEIARYVAGGDPMDKAGAYAIQGGAAHMIDSVRGSYTNVIGLPVRELLEMLQAAGAIGIGGATPRRDASSPLDSRRGPAMLNPGGSWGGGSPDCS